MLITQEQLLTHLYYNKLPQVYREADRALKTYPLKRYLSALVDGGYAELLTDINGIMDLIDPQKCPEEFLPYLCESFGLEYFEDIAPQYQRRFLSNIGEIIKRRGTYSCVRFLTRVLTGLNVELEYIRGEHDGVNGRHLIVTLLSETVEQLLNIDTSMAVVERYLKTQIPYYIAPSITSRIVTQQVECPVFIAGAVTIYKSYDLVDLKYKRTVSTHTFVGLGIRSLKTYDLTGESTIPEVEPTTSSVLGEAVLGEMILGGI